MHCCLAVGAAAKLREVSSASRALSIPILDDGSNAKITDATAIDCILHLMAQLPSSRIRRGSVLNSRTVGAVFDNGTQTLQSNVPAPNMTNDGELWSRRVLTQIKGQDLLCKKIAKGPAPVLGLPLKWAV
jgi:hypothetical protein